MNWAGSFGFLTFFPQCVQFTRPEQSHTADQLLVLGKPHLDRLDLPDQLGDIRYPRSVGATCLANSSIVG
jgi:hypothetical protein